MQKLTVIILFLVMIAPLYAQAVPAPGAPADFSKDTSADDLWAHIDTLKGVFMDAMRQEGPDVKNLLPQLQDGLKAFVARYPDDERSWSAKMMLGQLDVLSGRMGLPGAPPPDRAMQQFEDIVADKTAPKGARAQASIEMIMHSFPDRIDAPVDLDALDAKIAAFQKEFGDFSLNGSEPAFLMLREQELQFLKLTGHQDRYLAILNTLAADPNPGLAEFAKGRLAQVKEIADLQTRPFELKYTAVDGTKIDLAQMRGKVVLIDFWATWCGPCVAELPTVLKVYQKYHGQGLEIVGVSLDQDKETLLDFTKKNGMTWPQYFDGGSFDDNAISKSFGIDSIPTMWLIDKKGMLVNTEAGADLEGLVAKLLKAP